MSTKVYNENGLPFWTGLDIYTRDHIVQYLSSEVQRILQAENRGWLFERIEAPCIIPSEFVSKEYAPADYFGVMTASNKETFERTYSLRPETTRSSYEYMRQKFAHQNAAPPYCVYQLGKSFRNENDQVSKNMRYKEFYQLEFQCVYTAETKNDYHNAVLEPLRNAVAVLTNKDTTIVQSDRLPSYSSSTMDIEVDMGYKWLEVCSISLRNDVPFEWNANGNNPRELKNVEIAFGADRLTEVLTRGTEDEDA